MGERLQKVLARHGLGSRRELESWMREGRILLNGEPAAPGAQFKVGDRVRVDGRDVTARLAHQGTAAVLAYHKPAGEVLGRASDPGSVLARLPAPRGTRWIPINRMSPSDSGLVLLTNDGRLAHALMRAAARLPAVYMVRVHLPDADVGPDTLARTVNIDGVPVEFEAVEPAGGQGSNQWVRVKAASADRRGAVRALFESQDVTVSRLIQIRYADVELPRELPRGRHRRLAEATVRDLYARAGLDVPEPPEPAGRRRPGKNRSRPVAGRARSQRKPGSRQRRDDD